MYTREQRQSAYKKLPSEVQEIIMSNETTELITTLLKEIILSDEQINLADSEILYSMFCLQSLDDAINNIAKLSNKNVNDLDKIKSTLQSEIFSKYEIDIDNFIKSNQNETANVSVPEIAPNNLPMVEEGEVVHSVPHVETKTETPQPTIREDKVSLPDYRYQDGKDPYREPLV